MNRIGQLNAQFGPNDTANKLTKDSLSVVDNRTGKYCLIPSHRHTPVKATISTETS